jgi:hypothetical protein
MRVAVTFPKRPVRRHACGSISILLPLGSSGPCGRRLRSAGLTAWRWTAASDEPRRVAASTIAFGVGWLSGRALIEDLPPHAGAIARAPAARTPTSTVTHFTGQDGLAEREAVVLSKRVQIQVVEWQPSHPKSFRHAISLQARLGTPSCGRTTRGDL